MIRSRAIEVAAGLASRTFLFFLLPRLRLRGSIETAGVEAIPVIGSITGTNGGKIAPFGVKRGTVGAAVVVEVDATASSDSSRKGLDSIIVTGFEEVIVGEAGVLFTSVGIVLDEEEAVVSVIIASSMIKAAGGFESDDRTTLELGVILGRDDPSDSVPLIGRCWEENAEVAGRAGAIGRATR